MLMVLSRPNSPLILVKLHNQLADFHLFQAWDCGRFRGGSNTDSDQSEILEILYVDAEKT